MNVNQTTCAATDHEFAWKSIDWKKCEAQVKKLQERIVKARKEGRHGKVQALQWTLTHSFAAKAIAVKRVTTNEGKKTPGVDGVLWSTDKAKYEAVLDLKRKTTMDIYARVKYNKPEQLFDVVNSAFHQAVPS